jgi:hypothetical protein
MQGPRSNTRVAGPCVAALVLCAATATAGPTRKVEVQTDPPGATIYLGDIDAGEACSPSPCTVNAPAGKKTAVIARKDGYGEKFGVIDLRKGPVKSISLQLTASTATLICDDPGLAGGTIFVDEAEKAKAPSHVSVEAGGHHVVITVKGRTVFDDFVKPDVGEEYTIKPNKAEPAPQPPKPLATALVPSSGDEVGEDTGEKVTKSADAGPRREPWIAGGGIFEVGFRQFRYFNSTNLPQTESEGGQVLIGPSLQLWPMRLAGSHHLRGLSLYAKVGFGANHRAVLQDPNATPTGASTYWGNIEVDLQHRWNLGDAGAIELGGGFVRDQLEYTAMTTAQIAQVPYADYQSMRLGVRGVLRLGSVEPYAQVEGRIPFSEGLLAQRFTKVDVTGVAAAAGLAMMFGPVIAKLEASIVYYNWSITADATGSNAEIADGARDVIEGISLFIGAAY